MSRVDIHVLTHNSAREIAACLTCLTAQDYPDYRITVIDNASTDDTVVQLQSWQAQGIQVVTHQENLYYSRAHNLAIASSDAAFVMTVNPDVLLAPDFLRHCMQRLATDPGIGSVNGRLLLLESDDFTAALVRQPPPATALLDSAGLMLYRSRRPYLRGNRQLASTACREPAAIFGVDGACAVYRRAMLDDIALLVAGEREYFDNDFVIYREDVDLAWRAQLFGWASYYEPAAIGYHIRGFHLGQRRDHLSATLRRHSVKNGWALLLKNDEPRTMLTALPAIVPYQVKILGGILTIERSSLGAISDLWKLWPRFQTKRQQIRQRRRRTMRDLAHWLV